jgi:hypothetical protein
MSLYDVGYGQRSIDCDAPPGGRITCESNQVAFCKVEGGQVIGLCQTPRGDTKAEIDAWVLSVIFGKAVSVLDIKQNHSFQLMLHSGFIESAGAKLRFSIPGDSLGSAGVDKPEINSAQVNPTHDKSPVVPHNPSVPFKPLATPQPTDKPKDKEKPPDKMKEPSNQDDNLLSRFDLPQVFLAVILS